MTTILQAVQDELRSCRMAGNTRIPQRDMLCAVVNKGFNKESVRGTAGGPNKLKDLPEFKNHWVITKNKVIVLKDHLTSDDEIYKPNYDDEEKQRVREEILTYIPENGSVVTLPAAQGLCVKTFLAKTKNIVTIEEDYKVYLEYVKLGHNTENHYKSVNDYFLENFKKFDVFFFDSVGYICPKHSFTLNLINDRRQVNTIAFTCSDIDNFRAQSAKDLKKQYENSEDAIRKTMGNYEIEKVIRYSMKNEKKKHRNMRVYILKLKQEDSFNEVYGGKESDFEGFSVNLNFNF